HTRSHTQTHAHTHTHTQIQIQTQTQTQVEIGTDFNQHTHPQRYSPIQITMSAYTCVRPSERHTHTHTHTHSTVPVRLCVPYMNKHLEVYPVSISLNPPQIPYYSPPLRRLIECTCSL